MRCKALLALPLIVMALTPASTAAWAQQGWVQLGCRDVGFNVDRDVIRVGRRDGRFTAIRLRVSGNDVRMLDLKVVYANGNPDDIPVRAVIRAPGVSRALDLRGSDRSIDRVELIYASRPNFRGRAQVCVDGREASAQAPAPAWVALGCKDVGFLVDRDVVQVSRRDGRFTAIRLRVAGNDVRMLDFKVVYSSGAPDDIPVRAVIRAGGLSGPLDLRGRDRAIERVELIYASRPNFRGRARVCVDGRSG
jgi:hypothetical protein